MEILRLRQAQLDAMRQAAWLDFESEAWVHCHECFPDECRELGAAGTQSRIRAGLQAGRRHGFEDGYDLLRYLNLVFAFGPDFDSQQEWSTEILAATELQPRTKMDLLVQRGSQEFEDGGMDAVTPEDDVSFEEEEMVEAEEDPVATIEEDDPDAPWGEPEEEPVPAEAAAAVPIPVDLPKLPDWAAADDHYNWT